MSSAKIYTFPHAARRPAPLRALPRRSAPPRSAGFVLLLWITLLAVFLYLSGLAGWAKHDGLYAVLLTVVWGFYFAHDKLLRVRVLGALLRLAGRVVLLGSVVGFFGGIYWLVFTHP